MNTALGIITVICVFYGVAKVIKTLAKFALHIRNKKRNVRCEQRPRPLVTAPTAAKTYSPLAGLNSEQLREAFSPSFAGIAGKVLEELERPIQTRPRFERRLKTGLPAASAVPPILEPQAPVENEVKPEVDTEADLDVIDIEPVEAAPVITESNTNTNPAQALNAKAEVI